MSLTFDDGYDTQMSVVPILADHGVHGTVYVNSGDIDTTRHLTWSQLDQIAAAGNEIAGHTVDHVDLTTVDTATATRQVCDDRARLLDRGYAVTNFAYPYGHGYNDPAIQSIVQQCGYNSARAAWGIGDGVYAETIPPADVWAIRVPSSADTRTLAALQSYVIGAEDHGGGWVPFYFHDVCDGCNSSAVSPSTLAAFLDWLAPRTGTTVKTVAEVIGGAAPPPPGGGGEDTTPPVSSITCNGGACGPWYASPVTVALSATDNLSGVAAIRYTTDGSEPTEASPVYSSPFTVSTATLVGYRAWDNAGNVEPARSQQLRFDTTAPTVSITYPTDGATVSSKVTFRADAADAESGVASVTFLVDGKAACVATTAPYACVWNSKKVKGGGHTVAARAIDGAGNAATSAGVTFTITR